MRALSLTRRRCVVGVVVLNAAISACDNSSDPPPPAGSLVLSVSGIPDTIPASMDVTGPNGYSKHLTGPETLGNLAPGSYTVAVAQVKTSVATFAPASQSLPVTVSANSVSQAAVIYSVITGSIAVTMTGAPPDAPGKVVVTGPAGYVDSMSASGTLGNLAPGVYNVSAREARKGLSIYAPKPAESVVTVPVGLAPVPATITYALVTGSLTIHVNGLPSGMSGNISVTGPAGFTAAVTGSTTLEGLLLGRYDINAAPLSGGAGSYTASPSMQGVTVVPGAVGLVNVNYWPGNQPPGLNLAVDAVQVQQVVQTYGGGVPLIAGREALVRVFVRASQPNAVAPDARVRLYEGSQQTATFTIPAPRAAVPVATSEEDLNSSWNVPVPGNLMRPGLRILVDVDPANAVAESAENDNSWPSSGAPLALDVRTVTPLAVRLVPVTQSTTGLTGNVNASNSAQYFDAARKLLPVSQFTLDVRQPYTTNAPPLEPGDGNGAWVQVLGEMRALQAAEGGAAHYYGVVKVPYTSGGIIGVSYLPSMAAVGWDVLPNAAWTMVHELGHNFARLHTNSCNAGGYDANYPYPGGIIGVYGYDPATSVLVPPSTPDIMGYCMDRWISDYTYTGILGFRATQASTIAAAVSNEPKPGLLVWGRIGAHGMVLEPAFEVNAPPRLPDKAGPHRIEVLNDSGRVIAALQFHGERVVDASAGTDEYFAFVIPFEALRGATAARIRLSAAGRQSELTAPSSQTAADFTPTVTRLSATRIRVLWRDAPGRGVLVRDSQTGAILTLARGGRADVMTTGQSVDLTLSDGVRSASRTLIVR